MNENALIKLGYYEIKKSMEGYVSSNLGRKKVIDMMPQIDQRKIERMLNETEEAMVVLEALTNPPLYGLQDITLLIERVKMGGVLSPLELLQVADVIRGMRLTRNKMVKFEYQAPHIYNYAVSLVELREIENEIHEAIQGQHVSSGASKELSRIRRQMGIVENRIETRLNKILSSAQNASFIQDSVIQQRNGSYVIPVKSSYKHQIPGRVVDQSSTGATVFICPSAVEKLMAEMQELKMQEELEIYQVLSMLTSYLMEEIDSIEQSVELLGELDFIFTRARYTRTYGGNRPSYQKNEIADLKGARYPLMEGAIPNRITIGENYRGLLITGPNTGGKTMTLKTIGLNIMIAQSGLLPAVSNGSRLSVFKEIFVDMGDDQDFKQSLSTFSAHIANLKKIVEKGGRRTLCLIDEIGTGTDPREGAAIGIAILTKLYEKGSLVMATSHYGELKEFAQHHRAYINASMLFDRKTLKPSYRLIYDSFGDSNGLNVARMLSMDDKVLSLAERILKSDMPHGLYESLPLKNFRDKKEKSVELTKTTYQKGDQVLDLTSGRKGLIFSVEKTSSYAKVLIDGEYERLPLKRLKLTYTRDQLYPPGYDLEQLFVSFKERKLVRDIEKKRIYKQKDIQKILKSTEK